MAEPSGTNPQLNWQHSSIAYTVFSAPASLGKPPCFSGTSPLNHSCSSRCDIYISGLLNRRSGELIDTSHLERRLSLRHLRITFLDEWVAMSITLPQYSLFQSRQHSSELAWCCHFSFFFHRIGAYTSIYIHCALTSTCYMVKGCWHLLCVSPAFASRSIRERIIPYFGSLMQATSLSASSSSSPLLFFRVEYALCSRSSFSQTWWRRSRLLLLRVGYPFL